VPDGAGFAPKTFSFDDAFPATQTGQEAPDFTGKYNTQLAADDEANFQAWVKQRTQKEGRDISKDLFDYDLRGAWKANANEAANGHLPDTWKKPNEPTFSTQSIYNGKDGYVGGVWGGDDKSGWSFTASPTNLQMLGPDGLQQRFKQDQQGSKLVMPPAAPKTFSFDDAFPETPQTPPPAATPVAVPRPDAPQIAAEQGMPPQSQPVQPGSGGQIGASVSRIAQAVLAGGKAGWQGAQPPLTPQAQAALDQAQQQGGITGALAKLGSILSDDFRLNSAARDAVLGAVQAGVAQTGTELGSEQAGRDIAAMPEAFMGMPGALRAGGGPAPPGPRARVEPTLGEPPSGALPGPESPIGPRPGAPLPPRMFSFEDAIGEGPSPEVGQPSEAVVPSAAPEAAGTPVATPPGRAAPERLPEAGPAAPTTEAALVESTPPVIAHGGPWTTTGKTNHLGDEVYENGNGVRAIFENGVPWTESVRMDPDKGMVPKNPGDRKRQFMVEGDKGLEASKQQPATGQTPKSFWTYQAETPPGPPSHMTRDQWESLSPGMRREIARSQPELWKDP
jgi:hypothetical protein